MAKPSEMERVVAARALLDTRRFENDEAAQLAAFMGIFHPGHPATEEIVQEKRREKQRQRGGK